MATESDLIFSLQANHNFSRILTDLKRANLSISNRLRSIRQDADFVSEVADAFGRPLIANERCGSWYIDPADKAGSAYFKSTDGHAGQWNFSSRRLNLHLLPIIGRHDGCIVVDSTRRGKQMPDALSKTVPIWCCVLNRVLFPAVAEQSQPLHHRLHTPPHVVSRSEHAQAEARIQEHVEALGALDIDVAALRRHVAKPLRPMWVTQESRLVPTERVFDDYHPVICCTSSRRVLGGEMSEGGYIQGAGDDTENWALGLTAPVFWGNMAALLDTPESELPELVRCLVVADRTSGPTATNGPVRVASCIFVSQLPASVSAQHPQTCTIAFAPKTTDQSAWVKSPELMEVGIGKQKLASRNLRVALASICDFVDAYLKQGEPGSEKEKPAAPSQKRILIACETGKDLSIGVALALVCRLFDDEGNYRPRAPPDLVVNKSLIKARLGRIMMAFPEANPSRTTLQSVNSYLMG
ncbi:initiator tRNA phosphoribosyl transferase [Xylaria cf. heliscus]|nr:initiator tRNA phosphoribosyl transferase [Xylaria cf. heliscus]